VQGDAGHGHVPDVVDGVGLTLAALDDHALDALEHFDRVVLLDVEVLVGVDFVVAAEGLH